MSQKAGLFSLVSTYGGMGSFMTLTCFIFRIVRLPPDGGVGKTALAVELGWRLFEARQFDFVLFLNASTPNRSTRSWRPFAMLLTYRSRLPQSRRLGVPA